MAGAPNLLNFKMMINHNITQNLQVLVEDIGIEDKIFGPNVSTLKIRTTRQSQKLVVDESIEIP